MLVNNAGLLQTVAWNQNATNDVLHREKRCDFLYLRRQTLAKLESDMNPKHVPSFIIYFSFCDKELQFEVFLGTVDA